MNFTDLLQQAPQWLQALSWTDLGEAFFVTMSVIGQQFISSRNSRGFHFWLAGNVVAVVVFFSLGRYLTMVLYCYFTWMCVAGLVKWRRLEQVEDLGCAAEAEHRLQRTGLT